MDYSKEVESADKEIREYGSPIFVINPVSLSYDPVEDERTFTSSSLSTTISASISTISVINAEDFPDSGIIKIESEKILFGSKKNNSFIECQRGFESTIATIHSSSTTVAVISEVNKTVAIFQGFDERWIAEGLVEAEDKMAYISSKDMTFEITPEARMFFDDVFYIVKNPGKVSIDGKTIVLYKSRIGQ